MDLQQLGCFGIGKEADAVGIGRLRLLQDLLGYWKLRPTAGKGNKSGKRRTKKRVPWEYADTSSVQKMKSVGLGVLKT